ncbi:Light-sensor Protein kinase [Tulasnella sp. 403]|nr:Light-sensor Protein kinase [Tulasnella sp. 403]
MGSHASKSQEFPIAMFTEPLVTAFKTLNLKLNTSDGVRIGAWYILSEPAYRTSGGKNRTHPPTGDEISQSLREHPTVMFFHGNAANRAINYRVQFYGQVTSKLRSNMLVIDYRGFGDSEGSPSEIGLNRDARAAWDWLTSNGASPKDIVIIGQSLGTGVGAKLVSELSHGGVTPRALVLAAPFSSIHKLMETYSFGGVFPIFRPLQIFPYVSKFLLRYIHTRFSTVDLVSDVRCPILLVHAKDDMTIPHSHSWEILDKLVDPYLPFWPFSSSNPFDALSYTPKQLEELAKLATERKLKKDQLVSAHRIGDQSAPFGTYYSFVPPDASRAPVSFLETERGGHARIIKMEGVIDYIEEVPPRVPTSTVTFLPPSIVHPLPFQIVAMDNEDAPNSASSDHSPFSPSQPTATPFIYPIRSLVSTVQPAESQPPTVLVDPAVVDTLAASLKREVAAKRAAVAAAAQSAPPPIVVTPDVYNISPALKASEQQPDSSNVSPRKVLATSVASATFPSSARSGGSSVFPGYQPDDFIPLPTTDLFLSNLKASATNDSKEQQSRMPIEQSFPPFRPGVSLPGSVFGKSSSSGAAYATSGGLQPEVIDPTTAQSVEDHMSERSSFSSLVRLPPAGEETALSNASGSIPPGSLGTGSLVALSSNYSGAGQGPPVTVRLRYVQDANGHHHVVGREGVLKRCEDEPIHAPGAIQSYGVIVVLEEDLEEGRLLVRQVSEGVSFGYEISLLQNAHRVLGLSIPYLFSLECFTDIFSYDQAEVLWKHVTFLEDPNVYEFESASRNASEAGVPLSASERNKPKLRQGIDGPEVFLVSGWSEPDENDLRSLWRCWCAAHRPVVPRNAPKQPASGPASKEDIALVQTDSEFSSNTGISSEDGIDGKSEYQRLIVLEFELEHDEENPIYSRHQFAAGTPETAGSRTDLSGGASGGMARANSLASGSGSNPLSGTSSGTTTTPMPPASDFNTANASSTTLPPLVPLTNAALQALSESTNFEMKELNLPTIGQDFSAPDTPNENVLLDSGASQPEVPLSNDREAEAEDAATRGLEGDHTWYPSLEDIQDSTISRSKPIKALEKMRLMARGIGTSGLRQSPALRRVAASNSSEQRTRSGKGSPTGSGAPGGSSHSGGSAHGSGEGASAPRPPSVTSSGAGSFRSRGGPAAMSSSNSVGTMDVFAVLAEVIEQLGTAPNLDTFLKIVVGVIKDLTQFHRVLVYQFDDAWNGQVVAELVDWSASHDLFKGLHFPASDIPPQARQLYVINKVRILYDREQPTSRLVCRDWSDLDHPLDMTHCYLRAMSPIHVKYLGNMGVRASMSISITAFGQLWGLITCHSYGNAGMRVSFPVRQMLRLLSDSISRNIERLSYAQRLHTRKLISTMPTDHHPTGYIVTNSDDLISLFDADYGVLVIGDGAKILGPNDHGRELLVVAQYLRMKQYTMLQASQSIQKDFPDLILPSGMDSLSGLLYVPLSTAGRDFVVFLRKGQLKDVLWAGRPHKPGFEQTASLEPRTSFKAWAQTVVGRCRAWTDEQIETAGVLALVYGKFIDVWRQKESAVKSTQLANLLLTNASHEVRTPLNQIIGFLELALEGNLDDETRSNLIQTHTASKSLLFTINDLLDLTRLESGQLTQFHDPFDLPALIREAVAPYEKDANRKGLQFEVISDESPQLVIGDSRKIASVVSNLTANAVKFTETGKVSVECKPFQEPDGLRDRETTATTKQVAVEIVVADTGCGIPATKLEDIFRQFEQVEREEDNQNRPSGLGLGLAVVARIVEQVGGQLRVDSSEKGSRFSFLLPFTLPDNKLGKPGKLIESRPQSQASGASEVDDFVSAISASHISEQPLRGSPSASVLQRESMHGHGEGVFHVQDSSVGIRGVKIDQFYLDREPRHPPPSTPHAQEDITDEPVKRKFQEAVPRPDGQLRIMVVEDERVNSALMVKRFQKWKHIPVPVANGQEAKDLIERDFDFDCVMMDLQMPIMDGYQATSAIRAFEARVKPPLVLKSHRSNGRIPIFAVSASISEDQRDDLWELGLDGWLLKPIIWNRLQELINGIGDLEQRRKDLYEPDHWERGGWLGWFEGNGPA